MNVIVGILTISSFHFIQGFHYEALDNGVGCYEDTAHDMKDKKECEVATTYLGYARTNVYEGNWVHIPPGCFVEESSYSANTATAYINYNSRGRTGNSKYKSICRIGQLDCEFLISVHQANLMDHEHDAYPFFGPTNHRGNPNIYGNYRQQPGLYNGKHWWIKANDASVKIFMDQRGDWVISTAGMVGQLPGQRFDRSAFNTMAYASSQDTCPEDIFFQWNYYNVVHQQYKPAKKSITVYGASQPKYHNAHNPRVLFMSSKNEVHHDEDN